MRYFNLKAIAFLLVFFLIFHLAGSGIMASQQVNASFWDENKGSVLTVIKGMVMLWIINLMRENIGGSDDEDIVTSAIKKGLELGDSQNSNSDLETNNSHNNEDLINKENEEIINYEYVTDEEYDMLSKINEIRQEQGLDLLELDMELTRIARRKALDMVDNRYFDHNSPTYGTPFEMIENYNIEYSLAGENLAESYSIDEAFQSLMDSPKHRENIIKSRYDRVGNGVVRTKSGEFMLVQLFIDSPDPAI